MKRVGRRVRFHWHIRIYLHTNWSIGRGIIVMQKACHEKSDLININDEMKRKKLNLSSILKEKCNDKKIMKIDRNNHVAAITFLHLRAIFFIFPFFIELVCWKRIHLLTNKIFQPATTFFSHSINTSLYCRCTSCWQRLVLQYSLYSSCTSISWKNIFMLKYERVEITRVRLNGIYESEYITVIQWLNVQKASEM